MSDKTGSSGIDGRRVFLDLDSLTQWDPGTELQQRFPMAEKVPITGLEPGLPGSWDACLTTVWGSVLVEDGLFRMWYWGQPGFESHQEHADQPLVCYAESEDGLRWTKPDLGITGQHRWPDNNLLTLPGVCMSVVPALPATDAKYLAAVIQYDIPLTPDVTNVPGNKRDAGTFIYASEDGLHWRRLTKVLRHGDWACLHADRPTGRYLLYNKVGAVHGLTCRRIAIGLESHDGVHWEGYDGVRNWRETFMPDDYDDEIAQQRGFFIAEYYGVGVYRAGEILVSVEDIFTVGNPLRPSFSQNPGGLCHFRLGFSHDGMHWRHPKGRPPWLELGAPGEPDAGFMTPSSTFVEHGDNLLFYYGGSRHEHGWCLNTDFSLKTDIPLSEHLDSCRVMLARIKRDRFAGLGATYKGRFDVDVGLRRGDDLFINAACPNGSVRVAIAKKTDAFHGSPRKSDHLPGFSFDDCVPFTGDAVRAPVRFRRASVAKIPADKHLCLRFELNRAEIFGYEWAGKSGAQ